MRLNRYVKSAARAILHRAGGLSAMRFSNRDAFRILMYHDFPSTSGLLESLAKQCAHIAKHYELVSMTDIGLHLRQGKTLPKNALAVTVDDGNRDYLMNGFPVFQTHKIPVTVFLVSGFLDNQLWLWWDQIRYLVEHSPQTSFELALLPGQPIVRFEMTTEEQQEKVISTLISAIRLLTPEERRVTLNTVLTQQLKVDLPQVPPPHLGPMTWSEVRQIAHQGVDIGAHTVTHPILSRIQDPQELFHEIDHSKRRIEEELKNPVKHFCYPYGKREHYNAACRDVLAQCGFQTAVTAEWGLNDHQTDPLTLQRIAVEPMMPEYYFQEALAGVHK